MNEKLRSLKARAAHHAVTVIVGGVALLAIVLGWIGFQINRHQGLRHLADSLYRAVQLLVLNFDLNFDGKSKPNGLVSVARWFGALTLFAGVLALFYRPLTLWLRLGVQRRRSRRVILLGFGAVNRALALALDGSLTAIDKSFDAAARRLAAERGILLVEAELADEAAHRAAHIPDSRCVCVACGSDQMNLEAGALAHKLIEERGRGGPPDPERILVHLSDASLMQDLGDVRDLGIGRGAPFIRYSVKEAAAHDLLRRARLPQRAAEAGHRRVHAVIFGGGDQGEALLREIAAVGHSVATEGPPLITILDRDAARVQARLRAAYPVLFSDALLPDEARPTIRVAAAEFAALDPATDPLAALQQQGDKPSAYFVATGDDTLNLRMGMRLEAAMQRRALRPAPIYVRSWDTLTDPQRDRGHPLLHLTFFGDIRLTAERWLQQRDATLILAQRLHYAYLQDPSLDVKQAWAALPDLYRRSNLRAAEHATCKLLDLGLQWRGMAHGVLPAITDTVREPFAAVFKAGLPLARPESGEAAALWDAYKAEHARWMVDRALEGFRPTEPDSSDPLRRHRSDLLRRHRLLVPFTDLAPGERHLDLNVLDLVLQCGEGASPAVRRLTQRLSLTALPPDLPGGDDAPTELELEIDWRQDGEVVSPYEIDAALLQAAKALIERWSKNTRACRLHLLLREPTRFPVRILPEHFQALDHLLTGLHPEIARDVTWLPSGAPRPSPVRRGAPSSPS